jgi:NADH:ubiquinone oxidoreductase subunit 5 (subunit L)/multisubunit Na+/H+ antiporter MnhA subunit
MVNHAIYKSCLFFAGGVVERKTGSADLDRLGALAGRLPLVFGCFLLAALAVAGIPPLNGFASKWMIYQGIIEAGAAGRSDWIVWLAAAMFGSVLTLAAMMKLVHAIFLGQPSRPPHPSPLPLGGRGDKEDMAFTIPIVALAALCVVFGIAAYALPLKYLILPILDQELAYSGIWQPTLATVLILVAIGFGFLLYGLAHLAETLRRTDVFIGGETLDAVPGMRVSGTAFYNTIEELPLLGALYHPARRRRWDLYRLGARAVALAYRGLAGLHDGILSTYLAWCLLATGLLFIVLLLE